MKKILRHDGRVVLLTGIFIFLLPYLQLNACPFCSSETGTQIKKVISDSDVILNLLRISVVFVIFAAVAFAIYKYPFQTNLSNQGREL